MPDDPRIRYNDNQALDVMNTIASKLRQLRVCDLKWIIERTEAEIKKRGRDGDDT